MNYSYARYILHHSDNECVNKCYSPLWKYSCYLFFQNNLTGTKSYGSLFLQIGDFLCFAGTNFWVTDELNFFLLWINFCYFKYAPDKSYFHVYWVRGMDNTYFQAILRCVYPICKTSKPGYFSLSFDYNICSDWLFLWSIRIDLIISWCIMSPTKHSEFNLK